MNIIVGNDGLFSFGIWIRTADPHLIYSVETKKRINDSKSVWLGDHIWVGQQCLILKGTQIGSGSIIGGGTVISNKRIPSNTAVAGNPAKVINDGVFFSDECVHGWTEEETAKAEKMTTDKWIYSDSNERKDFAAIDLILRKQCDAAARLEKIEEMLVRDMSKNRFYVGN